MQRRAKAKPQRLDTPPITIGPITHPLGHFLHVIRAGDTQDVVSISEVHISPRCTAPLYSLANGEKIIVTGRPHVQKRPSGVDGVLRTSNGGKNNLALA